MPPVSIAICITDLDPGGAERNLVELAVGLDREQFQPAVYCLSPPPMASWLPDRLAEAGVPVTYLHAVGKLDFLPAIRNLTQQWRSNTPQLVQTFLFHANIVGRLAARRAGVPRVVSGIRVAQQQGRWHLWVDRATDRWVDRHVCVSQAVADFSRRVGHLPAEKLVVIPNGIDGSRYSGPPADLSTCAIPAGAVIVTYVGRLDRQKGLDWLLRSTRHWLGSVADGHLLLVGDGPEEDALRRRAAASGLGDRIHFAGWRPDVPAILAASRLLVLPSRWEGMPNVVLEAMAAGRPVVASDVEGVRELLGPAADAQTVPFGDYRRLAERILALLESPALAGDLGEQNRQRALACFSTAAMVGAYQRLWISLLPAT